MTATAESPVVSSRVDLLPLNRALSLGPAIWDRLVAEAPIQSPFAGWAWHQAWADAASPDEVASCQALVLRTNGDEARAVLPFRLVRTRFRRAPVTALEWAVGDLGCPDHLDFPARKDAGVDGLPERLEPLPWDVILLDNLAERAPNADRLAEACQRRGWWVRRTPLLPCPYLELPASWDGYLATLTPTRRQTIRRKERNLRRRYAVEVTDYGADRLPEGWRTLKELHARRWDGAGAFQNPRLERMHLAFARLRADASALWLVTLDLDGAPAAAWYGFAMGDTVFFYQGGWDPRWERHSVGAVLMGMMIRRAIERGYRVFDFLRGDEPYKMTWTSTSRACHRMAVIRRGLKGTALKVLDGWARRRERPAHA